VKDCFLVKDACYNNDQLLHPGVLKAMVISTENAEHYVWGKFCEGWHLLKRDDMSIIQERVPAGAAEVMHYHSVARQFFYILEGQGAMTFDDQTIVLEKGHGIEIPPEVKHQLKNVSDEEVLFLVISMPTTRGDRINV
jgi:mannose-6-phosphate isomerase-like protein (cupin superfamily)